MKKISLTIAAFFAAVIFAVSADAAVSSPCTAKPKAQAPRPAVLQDYRRDVLGSKVPVYTHKEGDAMTDTATKYEETLISGQE